MGLIQHFKKWQEWRKYNRNNKFYQFLVLFKIVISPTFELFITKDAYHNEEE